MDNNFKKIFLYLLLLLTVQSISAQMLEPVKWSFKTRVTGVNTAELHFIANIDRGWHLYSQHLAEGGPLPTEFKIGKTAGITLVGAVSEPKPEEIFDKMFSMKVQFFNSSVTFVQKVKILTDKPLVVKGTLSFQTCNDESCIPGEAEFTFEVPGIKAEKQPIKDSGTVKPEGPTVEEKSAKSSSAQTPLSAEKPAMTPTITQNEQPGKTHLVEAEKIASPGKPVSEPVTASRPITEEKVRTVISTKANNDDFTGNNHSLLWFFLQAFLWGLMAILTPCVFPMIPMTVSYFMKSGSVGKIQALIYGLSIVTIYVVFGVLIAVLFGADFGNWLSTHWIPNVLFFLIFVIFAASFFGYFEITMPRWLIDRSVKQEDQGGVMGTIFMAFTLVLVSFSCTGPIVGTVLVQAVGGQLLKPIFGMLGFSLAFAIPFTLFAFFPQWLNRMPKSGGWLNSVKVVIGFVELAFALKFLNVPDQTYHWGILDREVYLGFWIVIFTMMGFYLLGKIRFPHDSDYPVVKSFPRLLLIITTFSFVLYLAPGLWGAPLKGISGWLPPMETQDFDMTAIVRDNSGNGGFESKGNIGETPKYLETALKLPHGLKGYFDFDQALKASKALNKPVFVDFTGHGCTNCREMENRVWSDPEILKRLRENFVVVALYVDDKVIEMPRDEWYTNKAGKEVRLLGKKNTEIQIGKFGTNSQPYYVILDSEGTLLVAPRAYDLNIGAFKTFLDDGVKAFRNNSKQGIN